MTQPIAHYNKGSTINYPFVIWGQMMDILKLYTHSHTNFVNAVQILEAALAPYIETRDPNLLYKSKRKLIDEEFDKKKIPYVLPNGEVNQRFIGAYNKLLLDTYRAVFKELMLLIDRNKLLPESFLVYDEEAEPEDENNPGEEP